jgi:hypothetical protein
VNPALALIAAVTIGGAVLAVSARDVRATLLGLLVVLLGAPLIADPWPDPLAILARIAATLLAVRLMSIGLRGDVTTTGTRIGWPAEVLLAGSAAVVGYGSHGLGAAGLGPAEAQAAGFALIVLAAAPLFAGRDALRLAVGALFLLVAAALIRAGLDPAPSAAEQLVEAVLTIALGGAIAVIVTAARAAGGLETVQADVPVGTRRRLPDAHRPTERGAPAGRPGRAPVVAEDTPRRATEPVGDPTRPAGRRPDPGTARRRDPGRLPSDTGRPPSDPGPSPEERP